VTQASLTVNGAAHTAVQNFRSPPGLIRMVDHMMMTRHSFELRDVTNGSQEVVQSGRTVQRRFIEADLDPLVPVVEGARRPFRHGMTTSLTVSVVVGVRKAPVCALVDLARLPAL
jgi:hypothetical protein